MIHGVNDPVVFMKQVLLNSYYKEFVNFRLKAI